MADRGQPVEGIVAVFRERPVPHAPLGDAAAGIPVIGRHHGARHVLANGAKQAELVVGITEPPAVGIRHARLPVPTVVGVDERPASGIGHAHEAVRLVILVVDPPRRVGGPHQQPGGIVLVCVACPAGIGPGEKEAAIVVRVGHGRPRAGGLGRRQPPGIVDIRLPRPVGEDGFQEIPAGVVSEAREGAVAVAQFHQLVDTRVVAESERMPCRVHQIRHVPVRVVGVAGGPAEGIPLLDAVEPGIVAVRNRVAQRIGEKDRLAPDVVGHDRFI